MNYETTREIEIALARHFNFLRNLIVPNVSWGLIIHECDLLIVTQSGYANEVEIKVSKSDLLRDAEKYHQHQDHQNRIRQLWFAVPEKLGDVRANIPERAGLLMVNNKGAVSVVRNAMISTTARKLTSEERYKVARLGALRIWGLKQKLTKAPAPELMVVADKDLCWRCWKALDEAEGQAGLCDACHAAIYINPLLTPP